jgi:hypothetical protein
MTAPAAARPLARLTYVPDSRHRVQLHDWTCSIVATWWALVALGLHKLLGHASDEAMMQAERVGVADWMVAQKIVNAEVGLTARDASGIQRTLEHYLGLANAAAAVIRETDVTWRWLNDYAGQGPIVLGSHAWGPAGHWCAVRRAADGRLLLMNPARRISGGDYAGIAQALDERQFNERRPWNAVAVIPIGGDLIQPGRDLRAELDGLRAALAHVVDEIVPALHREARDAERDKLVAEARRIRAQFLGHGPAA